MGQARAQQVDKLSEFGKCVDRILHEIGHDMERICKKQTKVSDEERNNVSRARNSLVQHIPLACLIAW